jgi:predicted aconitase with swiveling domain
LILKGRGVSRGRAEGNLILIHSPFSFLGGVDTKTGSLLAPEELKGRQIAGRVLVFPVGKGSTVGSYTILELKRAGNSPVAIVNEKAEPIVATGAVMAGLPLVDKIDLSLLRDGDYALVDGNEGTVEIPGVAEKHVVSCVLKKGNRILILKRSEKVGTFRGHWAGVSGFVEKGEMPLETAFKEILEELGINNAKLVKTGTPLMIRSGDILWTIHPYLFDVDESRVTTDWEHTEYRWILPSELASYEIVPGLDKVISSLLASDGNVKSQNASKR